MAKTRYIQVSFWDDPSMQDMTAEERYFYLFLITNPRVSLCGIYELSVRHAEYYTGYNRDVVTNLIKRFEEKGKVMYDWDNHMIALKNWAKHNILGNGLKSKMIIGIIKQLKETSNPEMVKFIYNSIPEILLQVYPIDTPSIPHRYPLEGLPTSEVTPSSNSNGNSNGNNNDKCKSILYAVMDYFEFNEMNNPDKRRKIHEFITVLTNINRIDYFILQFEAYKEYKKISNQIVHSFPKFLGDADENHENGGWNAENWEKKLQAFRSEKGVSFDKEQLKEDIKF